MTSPFTTDKPTGGSLEVILNQFADLIVVLRPQLIKAAMQSQRYRFSREDAEDCVQDTWVRCHNNLERLSEVKSPEAWIRSTFEFCCRAKRDSQSRLVGLGVVADNEEESKNDLSVSFDKLLLNLGQHDGPRTSADYHIQEPNNLIWDAVLALPDQQRRAVLHRVMVGEPYEEIARIMDCKPATVRSHVRKALPKMKKFVDANRHTYD